MLLEKLEAALQKCDSRQSQWTSSLHDCMSYLPVQAQDRSFSPWKGATESPAQQAGPEV